MPLTSRYIFRIRVVDKRAWCPRVSRKIGIWDHTRRHGDNGRFAITQLATPVLSPKQVSELAATIHLQEASARVGAEQCCQYGCEDASQLGPVVSVKVAYMGP
jgi:hypothetical protein